MFKTNGLFLMNIYVIFYDNAIEKKINIRRDLTSFNQAYHIAFVGKRDSFSFR